MSDCPECGNEMLSKCPLCEEKSCYDCAVHCHVCGGYVHEDCWPDGSEDCGSPYD